MIDESTQTAEDVWAPILEGVRCTSLKYRILDAGGNSIQWLEITSSSCMYVNSVGPTDVARLLISSSLVYQVDVTFPILRTVDRLKGVYSFLRSIATELKIMCCVIWLH